jgi:hypothetical protein
MAKVYVPLNAGMFELVSGRQLAPGEMIKLSDQDMEDNQEILKTGFADGAILDADAGLDALSVEELRNRAKSAQVEGYSKMNKDDLVKALEGGDK